MMRLQEERCLCPLDNRPLSRARRSLVGESGCTPPRSFCGVVAPSWPRPWGRSRSSRRSARWCPTGPRRRVARG
nr:MAG TPA: hypothetical protein [Caudoviricetes sp.]